MERKPFILAAPLAFVVFLVGVLISIISAPTLDLHNLSALGKNDNYLTAVSFGITCVTSGILVMVYGFGKMIFEKGAHRVSGAFFLLGGLGLLLVGVYDASQLRLHNMVTVFFMLMMVIGISIASVSDIVNGNKAVFYTTIIIMVLIVVQWPIFTGAMSECVAIGLASVWAFVQTMKYEKEDSLATAEAAEVSSS